MNSYDGNPVYRPQVFVTETVEGMEGITQVIADRESDYVTLRFQKDSGEDVIVLDIPCYEKGSDAGFLGGDFASSLIYALDQAENHAVDTTSHLTSAQKNWIVNRMEEPIDEEFSFTSDTEIVPTTLTDATTNATPKFGDDLQTCIRKLMSGELSYWRHVFSTNQTIANLQSAVATKAPLTHTHTTDDVKMKSDPTKNLTTKLAEMEATAVAAAKVETAVSTVDGLTWFVTKYKHGTQTYCVATTHYDTEAVSINTRVYSGYNFGYPLNALATKQYPVTFTSTPDIFLGVSHLSSNSSGTLGVGVWAVPTNVSDSPTTKLPMIRLQCASTVSAKLAYHLAIRVEGYI